MGSARRQRRNNGSIQNRDKSYFAHPASLVETEDIGAKTRIWAFAHVMAGARVGRNCNIGDHAFIESGAIVGDNVTVKNGVSVWTRVVIENDVFLGPNCVFTNDPNPRAYIKKGEDDLLLTRVCMNATIGANATVLCGITVGRYALIGAGCVVLLSVPDFALMVGNPARQVGWVCICAQRLPLSSDAPLGTRCVCRVCKRGFERFSEGVRELKPVSGVTPS